MEYSLEKQNNFRVLLPIPESISKWFKMNGLKVQTTIQSFTFINAISSATCFRTTQLFLHNFYSNSYLMVLRGTHIPSYLLKFDNLKFSITRWYPLTPPQM